MSSLESDSTSLHYSTFSDRQITFSYWLCKTSGNSWWSFAWSRLLYSLSLWPWESCWSRGLRQFTLFGVDLSWWWSLSISFRKGWIWVCRCIHLRSLCCPVNALSWAHCLVSTCKFSVFDHLVAFPGCALFPFLWRVHFEEIGAAFPGRLFLNWIREDCRFSFQFHLSECQSRIYRLRFSFVRLRARLLSCLGRFSFVVRFGCAFEYQLHTFGQFLQDHFSSYSS